MANIDIFNLDASGSELFNDSENFLADLDEQEQLGVGGGFTFVNAGNSLGNVIVGSANVVASATNISGGTFGGSIAQANTIGN